LITPPPRITTHFEWPETNIPIIKKKAIFTKRKKKSWRKTSDGSAPSGSKSRENPKHVVAFTAERTACELGGTLLRRKPEQAAPRPAAPEPARRGGTRAEQAARRPARMKTLK